MNMRFPFRLRARRIAGLALMLCSLSLRAEPFRITTWDLQPSSAAGTNGWSGEFQKKLIQEAADSLKKLKPDVIVLQQIAGWESCRELAQALRPENYQVTVCSSFRDPRTKLPGRQVAILSKAKAFISWSEAWQAGAESSGAPAPGGFAFAAIRLGDKTVGVFSIQLDDAGASSAEDSRSATAQQAREEAAGQLVKQIASLQNWKNNRPEAFVVAGNFNTTRDDSRLIHEKTLPRLEQYGFDNAFAGLPLEQRVTLRGNARRPDATVDYIFTRDAGVTGGPTTRE
jgi:endonuclease/exonuclease/phosphatase family metal-dependent hydrolase